MRFNPINTKILNRFRQISVLPAVLSLSLILMNAEAQAAYRLERVASGVNQPTHVAFAPGDDNTMYIVERVAPTGSPLSIGRILKHNIATNTNTEFLDFTNGNVSTDSGLLTMVFHPDYNTNGKFYIGYAADPTDIGGSTVFNNIDEYVVSGGVPSFNRKILRYQSNGGAIHTVDWLGFRPGATGADKNYMYITTGDGGPQASTAGYINRAQDLNTVYGKVLRIDVGGADAYPADPDKNFGIPPAINTFPGAPAKLGEVIASGLRNPFRASIDRATGDMYLGDVGFNDVEEVNFLKSDWYLPSTRIPDYGWPKRDGIVRNTDAIDSIEGLQGASLNPIKLRNASAGDNSVTGGHVYRGQVTELQGKYIYADFIADRIYMFNFDRNFNGPNDNVEEADIDEPDFNADNVTNFQDVTALFESLIVGNNPSVAELTRISSFAEDNAGNLYLVKFADNVGNHYSSINEGQIYRIVPEPGTFALLAIGLPLFVLRRFGRRG